jgi:hypothetical protein
MTASDRPARVGRSVELACGEELVGTDGPETGIALMLQLGISIGRTDMAV